MYWFAHSRDNASASCGRVCVCLLLVFFLLYNPFGALRSSASGLNVGHPASHRATVGASELQHFSFVDGQDPLSIYDSAAVATFMFCPDVSARSLQCLPQVLSPQQQFFGSSLWFRPPPTH
jgi:hypothetical protein